MLRARAGRPFWHGSPVHFPLRLRKALGGDTRKAVILVYAIAAVGALAGLGSAWLWACQVALWVLGGFALVLVCLLAALARTRMEAGA